MDKELVMRMVKETIIDFFDEEIDITEDTRAADIDGWDSLAHISLLASLEEKFKIRFSISEAQKMKNVGEMVDVIKRLIGDQFDKVKPRFTAEQMVEHKRLLKEKYPSTG